jgi:membrane protease YdiL (CAAX protease family)
MEGWSNITRRSAGIFGDPDLPLREQSVTEITRTERPHWIDRPRNVALILSLQAIVGLGIGLGVWWATGRSLAAFVGLSVDDLMVGLLATAGMIGAMQAILFLFPRFLAWAADQQRILFASGEPYSPLHILVISIGAGIGEEALFRGGLQTWLGDHLPTAAAILLVSFAFAALHLGRPALLVFIFAYSLAFGLVYATTGSLAGVMIAHAMFDIWALTLVQRESASSSGRA